MPFQVRVVSTIRNSLDWFNQIYSDLIQNIDQGCIGGAFFEYNDEPLKADVLQQTMGVVNFSVAFDSAGNRSDSPNIFIADTATRKGKCSIYVQ
jgi:hypothetical protein